MCIILIHAAWRFLLRLPASWRNIIDKMHLPPRSTMVYEHVARISPATRACRSIRRAFAELNEKRSARRYRSPTCSHRENAGEEKLKALQKRDAKLYAACAEGTAALRFRPGRTKRKETSARLLKPRYKYS